MHTQKAIEQLGYEPNEAKVYLAVLSLGDSTVSEIANKAKLPRTSTQIIVEKLHKDGLVNFYSKKRYKYWVAENPEKFLLNLKSKEENFRATLPRILSIKGEDVPKPNVRIFSGEDEIKLIHQDILETKQHVLAIIPWEDWIKVLGEEYVNDFIETRKNHFLRMKLLVTKTKSAKELIEDDVNKLRHTRFMPSSIDIGDTIFVYGNKVAIISLNKKYPTGIVIEDDSTRQTMSVFFELLWDQCL